MVIVVTRCYNEISNIDRFINGYSWADKIIVSDGGSTDGSWERLKYLDFKNIITLLEFKEYEQIGEYRWNPDAPHINFIINEAKKLNPDWIVLDDMDDVPNKILRESARYYFDNTKCDQINAFRLYLWGDKQYFPQMNDYFNPIYTSLWAWRPDKLDIHADEAVRHGTIVGVSDKHDDVLLPGCLLHRSWLPETIDAKIAKYNEIGLPMNHPFQFAGSLADLPDWTKE